MIKNAPAQLDALMGLMDSLADPTRLRLLRLLERHELGVVDLCDILQLPQSTVSRHLKMLADAGWVTSRREATSRRLPPTSPAVGAALRRITAHASCPVSSSRAAWADTISGMRERY